MTPRHTIQPARVFFPFLAAVSLQSLCLCLSLSPHTLSYMLAHVWTISSRALRAVTDAIAGQ
eukprot:COSAG06_NODE_726_length_12765_cov_10.784147_9_plen_62_part_00